MALTTRASWDCPRIEELGNLLPCLFVLCSWFCAAQLFEWRHGHQEFLGNLVALVYLALHKNWSRRPNNGPYSLQSGRCQFNIDESLSAKIVIAGTIMFVCALERANSGAALLAGNTGE
jgi:hypothetical protein